MPFATRPRKRHLRRGSAAGPTATTWDTPGSRAASAASIALSTQPLACVNAHWAMRRTIGTEDPAAHREWRDGHRELVHLVRDIFGNPFRPVAFSPSWRTDTAVPLARQMYESRDFSATPILADALQDAGCDNAAILDHCRGPGPACIARVLGRETSCSGKE